MILIRWNTVLQPKKTNEFSSLVACFGGFPLATVRCAYGWIPANGKETEVPVHQWTGVMVAPYR